MLLMAAARQAMLDSLAESLVTNPFFRRGLLTMRFAMPCVLAALACSGTFCAVSNPAKIADRAALLQVVDTALTLMQQYSVRREDVDWPRLIAQTKDAARSMEVLTEDNVYRVIQSAASHLGDHHTRALAPSQVARLRDQAPRLNARPSVERYASFVGVVRLPAFVGFRKRPMRRYAQDLQDQIASVHSTGVCGWMIDLRGNSGGNMWPMLAGLGPILGDGTAGRFVSHRESLPWGYTQGSAMLNGEVQVDVRNPVTLGAHQPVAVLTDSQTASSAEAIAIAFRGRPMTRSFGQATRGLSTSNRSFPLPGGGLLVLTTAVDADRAGRVYGGSISPDVTVDPSAAAARAAEWLRAQGCRRTSSDDALGG